MSRFEHLAHPGAGWRALGLRLAATVLLGSLAQTAWSHDASGLVTADRADGHGPIGVMGDHTHKIGEAMLSYRYMEMVMNGERSGSHRISNADVFAKGFTISPRSMRMKMHMFGAMYPVTDRLTLMAMAPWVKTSMKHVTKSGARFTTRSEGLGDIKLTGMFNLWNRSGQALQVNLGVSLPTGSIDKQDATPAGPNSALPYPMQLGSGTWDLLPSISWRWQGATNSAGLQVKATIRTGENNHQYTLGDRYEGSGYLAHLWAPQLSTSVRLALSTWGDVRGRDDAIPAGMIKVVPTADPDRRAGTRADLLVGINYYANEGSASGNRLALEVGRPVYQKLDGPQLETDWLITAGWQYTF